MHLEASRLSSRREYEMLNLGNSLTKARHVFQWKLIEQKGVTGYGVKPVLLQVQFLLASSFTYFYFT